MNVLGNAHVWIDLDQYALGGVDVDLKQTGLVERRIEERQEALVGDIGTSLCNIAAHLGKYTLVVIAVEKSVLVTSVLVVSTCSSGRTAAGGTGGNLVGLQTCLFEYDDESRSVFLLRSGFGHLWNLGYERRIDPGSLCAIGFGRGGSRRRRCTSGVHV